MNLVFQYPIQVGPTDIDALNHVNNITYLSWLMDAAIAHSRSLGYELDRFIALGGAFVVRRHELDYLRSALLGDSVVVETWVSFFEGSRTTREYRVVRESDAKILLKGTTHWVWIDIQTGRPKNIPQSVIDDYSPFLHTKSSE